MPTKSVDLAHLRSVVLAGHAGAGKTTLAEHLLFRTGAIARLGKVDDGTASLDFEPEEQKRRESLSARGRHVRRRRDPRHAGRHARLPGLRGRGHLGVRRRRRGAVRGGRLGWRRGRARDGRRPGPVDRPGRRASSSTSATARTPTRPPRSTRCGRRSERRSPRSTWRSAPPSRSAATSTSSIARPGSWDGKAGGRDPDPGRARRRGLAPPRPAPRGRRRGRRRRPDQVPRRRGDQRPGARGVPAQGRPRVDPRARARRQRDQGIGLRGLLDAFIRYLPSPAEEPPYGARDPKSGDEVGSRPIRPGRSSSASSRPRPTRSSAG